MDVVLFTLWRVKNYGAEMQTYATVKILKMLGHKVSVINIKQREPFNLRSLLVRTISKFTPENLKFEHFWRKYIPSSKTVYSFDEVERIVEGKALIVGSDQVWNPFFTRDNWKYYFLPFRNKYKIAYASSFGTNNWGENADITNEAKLYLKQFSSLSSREQTGVNILKDKFNLVATNVLDPTLLHDGYPEIIGNIIPQNSLVYYPLSKNIEAESFCIQLASQLGLEYKNANKIYSIRSFIFNRPSVNSWLKTISEGRFIITPSFHGMTMSLLYHKQFIVIDLHRSERSSRVIDLLKLLNLEDRYFTSYAEILEKRPWEKLIDYTIVDRILNEQRDKSISYLKKSLSGLSE